MNKLEEITISVPENIAQAYREANEAEKTEMMRKISFFLQPVKTNKRDAISQLRQTMTAIGNKAIARGLTPEILEDILKVSTI